MESNVFYRYLQSTSDYPLSVRLILLEFLFVSFVFSYLYTSNEKKSDLYYIFLAFAKLHIKLFTLLGLMGTVSGMIDLFYTASIDLNEKWMAIGLANTIKPSLMGMLASIICCVLYYVLESRRLYAKK